MREARGAKKLDTNSNFEVERVRSPSPANGGAGLRSARATPSLWRGIERNLILSGENKRFVRNNFPNKNLLIVRRTPVLPNTFASPVSLWKYIGNSNSGLVSPRYICW